MPPARTLLTALLTASLLSACASVSFKQGAGGADYKADERACLGTTTERTAFLQCMDAKGWWTRSSEELTRIALVPVDESEAATAVAEAAAATASQVPTADPGGAATGTTARVAAAAPTPIARDPLARLRVAMWSKMGAGTPDLIADQQQCLAKLGDAHAPDNTAGTVTRAMYECMKERAWTALTFR